MLLATAQSSSRCFYSFYPSVFCKNIMSQLLESRHSIGLVRSRCWAAHMPSATHERLSVLP